MRCNFYETTVMGQKLVGVLWLRPSGVIEADGDLAKSILDEKLWLKGGERLARETDQERWFRSLPLHFNGSYFRAELVEEEVSGGFK